MIDSGLSTINAGALRITGALSLGPVPGSPNASEVTLNGGALEAANNVTLNDGNIGMIPLVIQAVVDDPDARDDNDNQGNRSKSEKKPEKYKKSILKYASEEVPALRELPWVAEKLKKDDKKQPFYRK